MTDLVVTICGKRASDPDYNELRFVLRSFAIHFPFLGRVFIIGSGFPAWLTGVERIESDAPSTWKDLHHFRALEAAFYAGASTEFVWASDDQFLLLNSEPRDFYPRAEGELTKWSPDKWRDLMRGRHAIWYKRLFNTYEALSRRGFGTIWNFDSHHPVLMNSVRLFGLSGGEPGALGGWDMDPKSTGWCINTLCFNLLRQYPDSRLDNHRVPGKPPPDGTRFWNVNEHAHWPQALEHLRRRFPVPCRFEVRRYLQTYSPMTPSFLR